MQNKSKTNPITPNAKNSGSKIKLHGQEDFEDEKDEEQNINQIIVE